MKLTIPKFHQFAAPLLAVLSIGVFLTIDNINPLLGRSQWLTQRWLSLAFFCAYFLVSLVFTALSKRALLDKVRMMVETNLIAIVTFVYFLIVNKQVLFGPITTGIVAIPLFALVYFVNRSLFLPSSATKELVVKTNPIIYFFENLLISVYVQAMINFFLVDRTSVRNFSTTWLGFIFKIDTSSWLIVNVALLTALLVIKVKNTNWKHQLLQTVIFVASLSQFLFLLENVTIAKFSYWHKAILITILVDFLIYIFRVISGELNGDQFKARARLSAVYHAIAMFLVIIIAIL